MNDLEQKVLVASLVSSKEIAAKKFTLNRQVPFIDYLESYGALSDKEKRTMPASMWQELRETLI